MGKNLIRFEPHSHTHYSNIRLLDCINRPKQLIDRAIELGLAGIAITDHECISSHPEVNIYAQKIQKEHPDFKVALGNEIYLCGSRESGQKYYHFILIAKNKNIPTPLASLIVFALMKISRNTSTGSFPHCLHSSGKGMVLISGICLQDIYSRRSH